MPTIEKRVVRDVVALDENASCAEAAKVMADRKIGSIGVSRGGALVGLVTERDLLFGVMAAGEAPTKKLGEVMRGDAPAVTPHVTERDCTWLMQTHHTRHLMVKDGGRIVGVVSMLDVLQLMLEDNRQLIEQLHTYIRGGRGG